MRLFTVGLVACVLSACQTAPYSAADAEVDAPLLTEDRRIYLLSELDRQREIWKQNKPENYKYTITNTCFCFPSPERGPNEIFVENEKVVNRIYRGEALDGYGSGLELHDGFGEDATINDMFDSIERHLKPEEDSFYGPNPVIDFTVNYDPIRGFPKSIYFDVERVVDEQYTLTVDNFSSIE